MRSPWVRRLGLLLVVTGLAMLGYVGWQMYGTSVIAKRQQAAAVEKTLAAWSEAPTTTVDSTSTGPKPKGVANALVRIPAFGKDYVVPVYRGTTDAVLTKGYGHFTNSVGPGEKGNYAIAAHRITHGEPLRRMPELRPGNKVIVETRTATYTYVLDTNPNDLVVDFTQGWVVDPLPKNPRKGGVQPAQDKGQKLLTILTCAELFHTDDRLVAFGHLVDTERKS